MNPLPLRDRIAAALRLEPMGVTELARVLCSCRRDVGDELQIMLARGQVRELPGAGWINVTRHARRAMRLAA